MSAGEAHFDEEVVSGLWSPEEQLRSIHHRDLLTIFYALQYFLPFCSELRSSGVCGQHDSAGLPAESGAPDPRFLNQTAQGLLRWAERYPISLLPQFIMGRNTFLSSQSNSGFLVDPDTVSVLATSEKVAGVNRPVRNLTSSPLLTLFFSIPRPQCPWDRGSSLTMEWVAGVCADSCDSVKSSARPLGSC